MPVSITMCASRDSVIARLLKQKGIGRYVIFDSNDEASKLLPGGFYPCSGTLIAADGRMFEFWLDWEAAKGDYTLGDAPLTPSDRTYWREVEPSSYERRIEYREPVARARQQLGLHSKS